jgi:hypothetical protein
MRHLKYLPIKESATRIPSLEYDRLRWGTPPARITRTEMQRITTLLSGHKVDHVSEDFEETLTLVAQDSTIVVSKHPGGWLLSVSRGWPSSTELFRADDIGDLCRQIVKSKRVI